jgi:predicted amidohydrolase
MQQRNNVFLFVVLVVVLCCLVSVASAAQSRQVVDTSDDHYIASVAERVVYAGSSNESVQAILNKNLNQMDKHGAVAGVEHQAQILVFPEFGLNPCDMSKRDACLPFCEEISVNVNDSIVICNNSQFEQSSIMARSSCNALTNNLVIAVNMMEVIYCDANTDKACPKDGRYQYNTELIFDETGAYVQKYHKSHPYFKKCFDTPPTPEHKTYQASFAVEFGLFICKDILYRDPPVVLAQDDGIKHFIYSVAQGKLGESALIGPWSKKYEVTLLSSNSGLDSSGIFVNGAYMNNQKRYTADYGNTVVATIPK